MNERAKELGCTGTNFTNTHGLTDPDLYTTAWDVYLIFSEAESHPLFEKSPER
jgi:D-alanyl-D-alanine carboxypeptidase (penicillin-binding protein 5/6)